MVAPSSRPHTGPASRHDGPPKLRPSQQPILIGPVDDALERAADTATAGHETPVAGFAAGVALPLTTPYVPASVHATLAGPGRPLPTATRAHFEPRLRTDLSGVRPHEDRAETRSKSEEHPAKAEERSLKSTSPRAVTGMPVPPSVHWALSLPGRPLDTSTRTFFERRFGGDFRHVRVHDDESAANSARDVDARAFTVGSDIVFAGGAYAPATAVGKRLIAHELAHVVQQSSYSRQGSRFLQRAPVTGSAAPVRAAAPKEKQEFASSAAEFLERQGEFLAPQTTRSLSDVLKLLRSTAEGGLSAIAGDPGATAIVTKLQLAYFDAVRAVLTARARAQPAAAGAHPSVQELYEQNRADILSFGQPFDSGAAELSGELEAALPARPTPQQRARFTAVQTARRQLRVATAPVNIAIEDLFSTAGAVTTIPLPANTTARFGSTVPANLRRGLSNVAGTLAGGSLTANTTVLLALDLAPFGGSYDAYRFTRLELGGKLGSEILIERQGAIGGEGLRPEERVQLQQRFTSMGFVRRGFSDEEFDQVLIGLGEIAASQLKPLGAVNFQRRRGADPTNPDAAANYDQATHTVNVFDLAYTGSMSRAGRPGKVIKEAARAIAHEIGHAIDLSTLRTTEAASERAEKALLAEFGTGDGGFRIPPPRSPDRARFDQLISARRAAEAAEKSARSLSGARWSGGNPSTITDDLAARAAQPAFRQAALQDGGPAGRQMPTTYPHPDSVWQEYFAESFSIFQTSPDLLRRLRPNVFRFMVQTFPP